MLSVVLVFYRKELLGFFEVLGAGIRSADSSSDVAEEKMVNAVLHSGSGIGLSEGEPLMRVSKLSEGVALLSSSDVVFSGVDLDAGDRYDQVGLVADVVQELKLVFFVGEKCEG